MIRFNRIMIGYGAFSKRAWDNSASLRGRPHDGAASTRAASKNRARQDCFGGLLPII